MTYYAIACLNGLVPKLEKTVEDYNKKLNNEKSKERLTAEDEIAFLIKVENLMRDALLNLYEINYMCDLNILDKIDRFRKFKSRADSTKEIEDKIFNIEEMIHILKEARGMSHSCTFRYENSYLYAYNFMDEATVSRISNALDVNVNKNMNILNVTCYRGSVLEVVKRKFVNSTTYGIINKPGESYSAKRYVRSVKENVDHVAVGTYYGGRISNDAFDISILNCETNLDYQKNYKFFQIKEIERDYLENSFRYARTGGVAVVIIPRFRLKNVMCQLIARKLEDINIFRLSAETDMCVIYGKVSSVKFIKEDSLKKLMDASNPDNIDDLTAYTTVPYDIPGSAIEITDFKGSAIDEDEISSFMKKDNLVQGFIEAQSVEKLSETSKRPLLPFKVGQIGLVLTSGCLDGIIDEGDGHYHLVKGMVNKQHDVTREETGNNEYKEDVITSNRVEINIILPNGDLKKLS